MYAKILLCVALGVLWLNGCGASVPQNSVVKETIIVPSKHKKHKHHKHYYRF